MYQERMGWDGMGWDGALNGRKQDTWDFFHIRLEGLGLEKWTVIDLALGAYGSIIDCLERAWPFFFFSFFRKWGSSKACIYERNGL
jgi:hypothetical protein